MGEQDQAQGLVDREFPGRIAVIGLGYVGLRLAAAFGKVLPTVGFDVNERRVQELRDRSDRNGEVASADLASSQLTLTTDAAALAGCDAFIVAVPTPVDKAKRPDLSALLAASRTVGVALRASGRTAGPAPIVIYESTVYPGCTEEDCVPVLEEASGLVRGRDFKVAYSPERINPGDAEHTLETVVKVVSGEDAETLETVASLYGRVVKAGVHRAPDIRTAEAAKVIENTQRDLNIALMNELAILFGKMGLDTKAVLAAAKTKWNFLPFEPGLVGGHCIPVDPYYLTHKAEELGYHPQVILAGRRINDGMGVYVAQQTVRLLIEAGRQVKGAKVLVLGATFKENVPDARNSRVGDLVRALAQYGCRVGVHDPLLGPDALTGAGYDAVEAPFDDRGSWDGIILAVPHRQFRERRSQEFVEVLGPQRGVVVDVRGVMDGSAVLSAGASYWRI